MDLEEQYERLLRYCYMKVRDRSLAEDLTQDAFIRFFESKTYRSEGKELAYLYTIAENLCRDRFRKRRELLLDDMPPGTQEAFLSRESEEADTLERLAVERALERLTEEERDIVMLRFSAELSIGDVGKIKNLSRFAVYRRLSGALKKLEKEMEER